MSLQHCKWNQPDWLSQKCSQTSWFVLFSFVGWLPFSLSEVSESYSSTLNKIMNFSGFGHNVGKIGKNVRTQLNKIVKNIEGFRHLKQKRYALTFFCLAHRGLDVRRSGGGLARNRDYSFLCFCSFVPKHSLIYSLNPKSLCSVYYAMNYIWNDQTGFRRYIGIF